MEPRHASAIVDLGERLAATAADRDRLAARVRVLEEALRKGIGAIEDCHAYRSHLHFITLDEMRAALGAVAAPVTEEKR